MGHLVSTSSSDVWEGNVIIRMFSLMEQSSLWSQLRICSARKQFDCHSTFACPTSGQWIEIECWSNLFQFLNPISRASSQLIVRMGYKLQVHYLAEPERIKRPFSCDINNITPFQGRVEKRPETHNIIKSLSELTPAWHLKFMALSSLVNVSAICVPILILVNVVAVSPLEFDTTEIDEDNRATET